MLTKILAFVFVAALVGKLFFPSQWGSLGKWFNRAINVMVIAIVVTWLVQLVELWLHH